MKKVLVILSTYNEKDNIRPPANTLAAAFAGQEEYRFDLMFVDDSPPDDKAAVIGGLRIHGVKAYLSEGLRAGSRHVSRAYLCNLTAMMPW